MTYTCFRFLFLILIVNFSGSTIQTLAAMEKSWEQHARADFGKLPTISDLYPEVKDDLTKVVFAHAVDSKKKLFLALRGKTMMIEADVSLGKLTNHNSSSISIPIMAHPPIKTSDLSLEEFLDTILDYSRPIGIKLDIKSIDVLEDCLQVLEKRKEKIRIPLWMNADILIGPVNPTAQPINPYAFLYEVKTRVPQATLSVGWTTKLDISSALLTNTGAYTKEQVTRMRDLLKQASISQQITFPVRAALSTSQESRNNFHWLLSQFPGSTLTVWSAYGDIVDVRTLLDFIDSIGHDRVYVDVPRRLDFKIARMKVIRTIISYFLSLLSGK